MKNKKNKVEMVMMITKAKVKIIKKKLKKNNHQTIKINNYNKKLHTIIIIKKTHIITMKMLKMNKMKMNRMMVMMMMMNQMKIKVNDLS